MIPSVKLHPFSIKHLKKGHPWVIKDQYTARFPEDQILLKGLDDKKKAFCTLLHDPAHPEVKARLWSLQGKGLEELIGRIEAAIQKRFDLKIREERNCFFLLFGEADKLPGLFAILFNDVIVLQYYSFTWKGLEKKLVKAIETSFKKIFGSSPTLMIQERNKKQRVSFRHLKGKVVEETIVTEFGIQYKIKLSQNYDLGLYPDMATIRKRVFSKKTYPRVLNLFSYTGAYSLMALARGSEHVCSVDSAGMAHDWLSENLELNNLSGESVLMKRSVQKALEALKREEKYDLIICDPPSFSTDGKKSTPALKSYETLLPLMTELLGEKGELIVFLNTHKVNWKKFEDKVRPLLRGLKIKEKLNLSEDCPRLKGFPEGDYLKGLWLYKS